MWQQTIHIYINTTMIKNLKFLINKTNYTPRFFYHAQATDIPRQVKFKWTKQQKKILFDTKFQPKILINYNDCLAIPGSKASDITNLYHQFNVRNDIPISAQNVALLMYTFTTNNLMNPKVFDKLEPYALRNQGQYKVRAIFGCLYSSIINDRSNMIEFFLNEYKAADKRFSLDEMLELVQGINSKKNWSLEKKQKFWEDYLKDELIEGITQLDWPETEIAIRFYDAFFNLQEFNDTLWQKVISLMENKKGWIRITLMQKLYAVSGTFEKAREVFQIYYNELSADDQVLRRYNFEQMRYYTPKQLFAIADQNEDNYFPKNYTVVPDYQNAEQWNRIYEEWLEKGSVKEQEQIIKDKSQSFGFAIKDRYQSMREDNIDLSKLSKQEFNQLFGSYEIAQKYAEQNNQNAEQDGYDDDSKQE